MSESKRWLEQGASRDIEDLLRAARAEKPSDGSLQRTLSAIGIGVSASAAAGSAAGSAGAATSAGGAANVATSITASVLAKWTVLGATLGTLGVGGAAIATRAPPEAKPPTSSTRSPARPGPGSIHAAPMVSATQAEGHPELPFSAQSATEAPASDPGAPRDTATTTTPSPSGRRPAPSGVPTVSGVRPEAETLAEEVRSMDRARAALAAGRPAQTLVLLDEYERRFPARGFGQEALYLRMEALTSLGQTAQALAAAERLLASYPNSPQSARARVLLSKNP